MHDRRPTTNCTTPLNIWHLILTVFHYAVLSVPKKERKSSLAHKQLNVRGKYNDQQQNKSADAQSRGMVIMATDTVNEDRCANQDTLTRSD